MRVCPVNVVMAGKEVRPVKPIKLTEADLKCVAGGAPKKHIPPKKGGKKK